MSELFQGHPKHEWTSGCCIDSVFKVDLFSGDETWARGDSPTISFRAVFGRQVCRSQFVRTREVRHHQRQGAQLGCGGKGYRYRSIKAAPDLARDLCFLFVSSFPLLLHRMRTQGPRRLADAIRPNWPTGTATGHRGRGDGGRLRRLRTAAAEGIRLNWWAPLLSAFSYLPYEW